MKNLVKVIEKRNGYKILFLCAESEEDYYNGNHDSYNDMFIKKEEVTNELREIIALHDSSLKTDNIEIIDWKEEM